MSHSFTTTYNHLSNQLINTVLVAPHGSNKKKLESHEWKALWDTGATNTVVSEKIVKELKLIPISYCTVQTPQGSYTAARYYLDIYLPNHVQIPKLLVTGGNLSGFDVLVGMDIIGLGDFAVSNFNSATVFSFRLPSMMHFDFVNDSYLRPIVKTDI